MSVSLTYARITEVVENGNGVFYRIAVNVPGGEISPGLIPADGLVIGDGLVFGAMVGEKFVPFGGKPATASSGGVWARIGIAAEMEPNRWRYEWREVVPAAMGRWETRPNGLTQANSGFAWNGYDAENGESGRIGSGINIDNLPSGFNPVPIAEGAVVRLFGPFDSPDGPRWHFEGTGHVDGLCASQQVGVKT